jgi:hypothetical protein
MRWEDDEWRGKDRKQIVAYSKYYSDVWLTLRSEDKASAFYMKSKKFRTPQIPTWISNVQVPLTPLLGALATKLLKVTISCVTSVCLSVRLSVRNNSIPTSRIFVKFYIWDFSQTLLTKSTFGYNVTKITGILNEGLRKFMTTTRWLFIDWRTISETILEKIKTQTTSITFFLQRWANRDNYKTVNGLNITWHHIHETFIPRELKKWVSPAVRWTKTEKLRNQIPNICHYSLFDRNCTCTVRT